MNIKEIKIGDIKEYSKNAKKHDQKQVKNISESIKQFGFAQPLVIDKDGNLIIGHGRLKAAKKLNMETVPCVQMDELTEEQVKKLRLLDNKLNESEWDIDILTQEMEELDFSGFDIDTEIQGIEDEQTTETGGEEEVQQYDMSKAGHLSDRFIVPPFSIIDTRSKTWENRKKYWIEKEYIDDEVPEIDPVLIEIINLWFAPDTETVTVTEDEPRPDTAKVVTALGNAYTEEDEADILIILDPNNIGTKKQKQDRFTAVLTSTAEEEERAKAAYKGYYDCFILVYKAIADSNIAKAAFNNRRELVQVCDKLLVFYNGQEKSIQKNYKQTFTAYEE